MCPRKRPIQPLSTLTLFTRSQFRGTFDGTTMSSWNSPRWKSYIKCLDGQLSFPDPFFPHVILNFRRKRFFFSRFSPFFYPFSFVFFDNLLLTWNRLVKRSVLGLIFDFVVLNLTKHSSYLIYNGVLCFSSAIQRQYREKYGVG